jgi:hypothetical protein
MLLIGNAVHKDVLLFSLISDVGRGREGPFKRKV